MAPRTPFGRPDLNGIWQAIGSHHWNIEPHAASHGPVVELAALGGVPGGLGIVEGGEIPYTAAARAQQQDNREHWLERDPAAKCYMPGVPRATYQPYPFQIVQTEEYILIAYEFASASRIVYMDRPDFEAPVDAWMGHSLGSWDGETLVIDVTAQVPDTWLDRSGNHHSNSIHVVERYTATGPDHLMYEATIEDPEVYTRPWTIRLPLYRRVDENMQLLEYKCVEFAEELMYGHLRKDPDLTPQYRASGFGSAYDGERPGPDAGDAFAAQQIPLPSPEDLLPASPDLNEQSTTGGTMVEFSIRSVPEGASVELSPRYGGTTIKRITDASVYVERGIWNYTVTIGEHEASGEVDLYFDASDLRCSLVEGGVRCEQ